MRLVTYARHGARRLGAIVGDLVVDLPDAVGHPAFPTSMEALARAGPGALEVAREALARARPEEHTVRGPRLLVPILPSSLRGFSAFEDHARTAADRRGEPLSPAWDEMPLSYKGNHRAIAGPEDEVAWPAFTDELDYEAEVACVLGARGRDLDEEAATGAILGYTLMNDWSARDVQRREMDGRLGPAKSKDFATSLGPCLVTADEIDLRDLGLEARVDGETWSKGNLGDARWGFPAMIAHVSRGEDVWPGDVYGSGTFGGGCGLDLGRALWPGAVVELEAPGFGVLRNRVGDRPAA